MSEGPGVYEWGNDGDSNNDDTTTPERNRNEGYEGGRLVKRTVLTVRLVSTLSVNSGGGGKGEVLRLEYMGHQTGTGKVVHKFDEQALSVAYDRNCRALVGRGGDRRTPEMMVQPRKPTSSWICGYLSWRLKSAAKRSGRWKSGGKLRQSVLGGVTRESTGPTMHLMPDDSRTASPITTTTDTTMMTTSAVTQTSPHHPHINHHDSPTLNQVAYERSVRPRQSRSLLSASNSLLTSISSLDGTTKPMSIAEQALHAHALGRVGDVVDILRMKQQQKLYNRSGVYGDDGSGGASDGTAMELEVQGYRSASNKSSKRCREVLACPWHERRW